MKTRIHVEQLPEGLYLATSDDLAELVAQGRTVGKLIEARRDRQAQLSLPAASAQSDYTIVVAA